MNRLFKFLAIIKFSIFTSFQTEPTSPPSTEHSDSAVSQSLFSVSFHSLICSFQSAPKVQISQCLSHFILQHTLNWFNRYIEVLSIPFVIRIGKNHIMDSEMEFSCFINSAADFPFTSKSVNCIIQLI